jgi:hypothetical protein
MLLIVPEGATSTERRVQTQNDLLVLADGILIGFVLPAAVA